MVNTYSFPLINRHCSPADPYLPLTIPHARGAVRNFSAALTMRREEEATRNKKPAAGRETRPRMAAETCYANVGIYWVKAEYTDILAILFKDLYLSYIINILFSYWVFCNFLL